jgi:hypothetical protein
MSKKLLLLILIIPNIFYCQSEFKNVHSKVISILHEKNIFPSDVQSSEINISDLINSENKVDDIITKGIYSIYYHYHWDSYLILKNKNEFILYTEPLEDTESLFGGVLGLDKSKKESKEYLKEIYNHLYYLLENRNSKGFRVISTNRKEYEKNRKKILHSELKRLKKEYRYYLDLIRKG